MSSTNITLPQLGATNTLTATAEQARNLTAEKKCEWIAVNLTELEKKWNEQKDKDAFLSNISRVGPATVEVVKEFFKTKKKERSSFLQTHWRGDDNRWFNIISELKGEEVLPQNPSTNLSNAQLQEMLAKEKKEKQDALQLNSDLLKQLDDNKGGNNKKGKRNRNDKESDDDSDEEELTGSKKKSRFLKIHPILLLAWEVFKCELGALKKMTEKKKTFLNVREIGEEVISCASSADALTNHTCGGELQSLKVWLVNLRSSNRSFSRDYETFIKHVTKGTEPPSDINLRHVLVDVMPLALRWARELTASSPGMMALDARSTALILYALAEGNHEAVTFLVSEGKMSYPTREDLSLRMESWCSEFGVEVGEPGNCWSSVGRYWQINLDQKGSNKAVDFFQLLQDRDDAARERDAVAKERDAAARRREKNRTSRKEQSRRKKSEGNLGGTTLTPNAQTSIESVPHYPFKFKNKGKPDVHTVMITLKAQQNTIKKACAEGKQIPMNGDFCKYCFKHRPDSKVTAMCHKEEKCRYKQSNLAAAHEDESSGDDSQG